MARTSTFTAAVTGTLAGVHVCRFMLSDRSVRFAVFSQFEFESFESVHIYFHFRSPPFMLTQRRGVAERNYLKLIGAVKLVGCTE